MESLSAFVMDLELWGGGASQILGIALVGSHARGTARPDSDIDVVVLVDEPAHYLSAAGWVERFGTATHISDEDWGLVQSRRVRYADGKEVEFGFTAPSWAHTNPVDPATAAIVAKGLKILHDPNGMLRALLEAVPQTSV